MNLLKLTVIYVWVIFNTVNSHTGEDRNSLIIGTADFCDKFNTDCTRHFYQANPKHPPDKFLYRNNQYYRPERLSPWTISYNLWNSALNVPQVKYGVISYNFQLRKLSGFCDLQILMRIGLYFGWYFDILPTTPSIFPTVTLAFWAHNPALQEASMTVALVTQAYLILSGKHQVFIISTDTAFSKIITVTYACYFCPEVFVSFPLTSAMFEQNGVLLLSSLVKKFENFDLNFHQKPKAIVDGEFSTTSDTFQSLERMELRDKIKIKSFLPLTQILQEKSNFTPILIRALNEPASNDLMNFTKEERQLLDKKITSNFIDTRLVAVFAFTDFVPVKNKYKQLIYCEYNLATQSNSKGIFFWISPYDSFTWIGLFIVLIVSSAAIKLEKFMRFPLVSLIQKDINNKATIDIFFSFIPAMLRQAISPRPLRIHLVLMIGFVVLNSLYEALITSQVIAPDLPFVYSEFVSFFKKGFKIYCAPKALKDKIDFPDIYEVIFPIQRSATMKQANLSITTAWFTSGQLDYLELPNEVASQIIAKQKLALPIESEEAEYRLLRLRTSDQYTFCHLITEKVFVGRLVWLFEGNLIDRRYLKHLFSLLLESGIVNMFFDNYKWITHDYHYEKSKVTLVGNDPKGLPLGKKVKELFGLYLTLNLLAGVISLWEVIWEMICKHRKRNKKNYNYNLNKNSTIVILVSTYDGGGVLNHSPQLCK